MRKKNYKGRVTKRILPKCLDVCRTFDDLQYKTANMLAEDDSISEIKCNVPLEGLEYTSDFVCTDIDGSIIVWECLYRKHLGKPLSMKLLELSRQYWLNHGITTWGIAIDAETNDLSEKSQPDKKSVVFSGTTTPTSPTNY